MQNGEIINLNNKYLIEKLDYKEDYYKITHNVGKLSISYNMTIPNDLIERIKKISHKDIKEMQNYTAEVINRIL